MDIFIVGIFIVLNVAISWLNCVTLGKVWVEMTHANIGTKLLAWLFALMPSIGFTWSYLIILVLIGYSTNHLSAEAATATMSLGYIIIVPGLLISGFAYMLRSWAMAYRTRSFTHAGVAGWNTFAQAYNTYNAIQGFGPAFDNVFKFFFKGKGKKDQNTLVLALVLLALLGGILTTSALIKHYAAQEPMPAIATKSPDVSSSWE